MMCGAVRRRPQGRAAMRTRGISERAWSPRYTRRRHMSSLRDIIVVGGGPAGLALSIAAAQRGLDVVVLERGSYPVDKACGEGLFPAGVRALVALGAYEHLDGEAVSPVRAIRWIDGGLSAEARLPDAGLGVRRTALSSALVRRARALGVQVREGADVRHHRRTPSSALVETAGGSERGRLLVAADGLASAVRRREGLEISPAGAPRYGLRRHFARAPWTDAVEVHFGEGAEAYVTPAGPGRVGIAFLCEEATRAGFAALLAGFPALRARVEGVPTDSRPAGAGPFARGARARALDRLVLLGDAAGCVDPITGEGVSLALQSALALGPVLPEALAHGAAREAFAAWERGESRRFARCAATARVVLGFARRPSARREVLSLLGRHPRLFSWLVAATLA
jgi:2-polyprenyl-6-methoxyphenol hydroxylase-like FAD-dependent oxidoreductase